MRSKNTASHIGHLGKKPELKYTPNGTAYTRFSIACNFSFKNKEGQYEDGVDWVPLIAYGKQAESVVKYLDKRSHIAVESRIKPWWNGKEGNDRRNGINIVVTEILFLDSKNQGASPEHVAEVPDDVPPEDIPF